MRAFIRDSGGIARQWKRFFDRDSGGVARAIRRAFLRDSGGVARLIYQAINLQNTSFTKITIGGGTATCTANIDASTVFGSGETTYTWNPSGSTNYEVEASLASGTMPTGTLNTWLSVGTTRSWSISASGGGSTSCSLTMQIRDATTLQIVATATFSLDAESVIN